MSTPQPSEKHLNVLRKYFGHSQFRPMQWKIIYSIIEEKRDNCVIMSTGYGKSLCYQYPAVYCEGLTIVISPLISLMQDQVLALQMSNIPACFLGSAQKNTSQSINAVLSGTCRVLYVTPEWSTSECGGKILQEIISCRTITLLAIDEAHCVSQWGHDFRSAYRNLSKLKNILPSVPVLAVTATATPRVRTDICCSLNLKNPRITVTSFNRPNLYFAVWSKVNSTKIDQIYKNLTSAMEKSGMGFKFLGPTIIYCASKNRTEEVEDVLKRHNIRSGAYHAGLSLRERNEVHEKFLRDQLDVVVATVAFGMGIDKPNVRCVIHYGLPKDIESYYQEVGRAGRDGLPAKCHVLYSPEDLTLNKMIMTQSQNKKFQEHKELMMKRMQYFCETRHCRRHLLLSYFEDSTSKEPEEPKPNCCDNCDKLRRRGANMKEIEKIDLTREIKLLLDVFDYFNGRFGLGVPIKFLRGQRDSKISDTQTKNTLYGAGKEHSEAAWKALAKLCIRENLLHEKAANSFRGRQNYGHNPFPLNTVAISQKGRDFVARDFKDGIPFELSEQAEMLFRKRRPQLPINGAGSSQGNLAGNKEGRPERKTEEQTAFLFLKLKKLRDSIAAGLECAPHMIIEDGICYHMALNPPNDLKDLTKYKGFTEIKVQKFGQLFIDKVKEFFGEKNPAQQCEPSINDSEKEDFLNMQRLNDNAVNFEEQKFDEYLLTDEVLNDFKNDEVFSTNHASQDSVESVVEKQNSSQDMWGDESDDIFDDLQLDEIVKNNHETCVLSSSNSANENNSIEQIRPSPSTLSDDCRTESKGKRSSMSPSCIIDSSGAKQNESMTTSFLFSGNTQKEQDVTVSLTSIHHTQVGNVERKNSNFSHSLMNSTEIGNATLSSSAMKKQEKCNIKILSSSASAKKTNIMYADDSDDDDDDDGGGGAKELVSGAKESTPGTTSKRSIPQWLTQPQAAKKRMKSNSIFKL